MEVVTHWNQRNVLVTGPTGFVGSWVVRRLLAEGARVVTLVRDWDPQSELIRSGDINHTRVVNGSLEHYLTLERALNEYETDTVFHLGAQTIVSTALRSPVATFEANIRGTYNLLEACRVHSALVKRVVVASSDKAYGDVGDLPYTEDMAPCGRYPYDVSKSCADLISLTYGHTYNLPVAVARCGNVYGGGDLNWSRIVPGTIHSILNGQRPVLRSDGKYTRDYIYVADVVEAYLLLADMACLEGIRGQAFNFSCEHAVTVLEITCKIRELMGRDDLEPIILAHAKAEIRDQTLDSSKAKRLLNWIPQYTLEKGLAETINWYKAFLGTGK